jgi:hypothetical protein
LSSIRSGLRRKRSFVDGRGHPLSAAAGVRRGWGGREIPATHVSRLRTVLEAHRGAQHPIRARDIATILGINDPTGRSVRETVNALIDAGIPVGSVNFEAERGGGGGYFLVASEAELRRCLAQYHSRARAILEKAERLERAYRRGPSQPPLLEPTGAAW